MKQQTIYDYCLSQRVAVKVGGLISSWLVDRYWWKNLCLDDEWMNLWRSILCRCLLAFLHKVVVRLNQRINYGRMASNSIRETRWWVNANLLWRISAIEEDEHDNNPLSIYSFVLQRWKCWLFLFHGNTSNADYWIAWQMKPNCDPNLNSRYHSLFLLLTLVSSLAADNKREVGLFVVQYVHCTG